MKKNLIFICIATMYSCTESSKVKEDSNQIETMNKIDSVDKEIKAIQLTRDSIEYQHWLKNDGKSFKDEGFSDSDLKVLFENRNIR